MCLKCAERNSENNVQKIRRKICAEKMSWKNMLNNVTEKCAENILPKILLLKCRKMCATKPAQKSMYRNKRTHTSLTGLKMCWNKICWQNNADKIWRKMSGYVQFRYGGFRSGWFRSTPADFILFRSDRSCFDPFQPVPVRTGRISQVPFRLAKLPPPQRSSGIYEFCVQQSRNRNRHWCFRRRGRSGLVCRCIISLQRTLSWWEMRRAEFFENVSTFLPKYC